MARHEKCFLPLCLCDVYWDPHRYRGERERAALAELREQREQELAEDDPSQAVTRTTAEPRPNAYLPEALGIPRPYGAYAPFKPSDPGSTMRHIRKPEPREIVI